MVMNFYEAPDIESRILDKMIPLCLSNPTSVVTEDYEVDEEEDW